MSLPNPAVIDASKRKLYIGVMGDYIIYDHITGMRILDHTLNE